MMTAMMMAVMVLPKVVVGLLVEMMLIGRASKKMRSELVDLSYFHLFLVLYAKGGGN